MKATHKGRRACGHVDVGTCPHQVLAATLSRESLPYPYSNQGTVRCIAVKVAVSTMSCNLLKSVTFMTSLCQSMPGKIFVLKC